MEPKELLSMTRTKLIEEVMKVPGVMGAHGMTKEELVRLLARTHGIDVKRQKGEREKTTIGELKKQICQIKVKREEAQKNKEKKKAEVLKKKLKRLKHRTRVLARQIKTRAA
jgi:hypothetical protein